jgi:hypothetical protein
MNGECMLSGLGCQAVVDSVRALTRGLEPPRTLLGGDGARTQDDWDVNTLFSVLLHLAMEEGYVLDYVYFWSGTGGNPAIYARRASEPGCRTLREYCQAMGQPDPMGTRYLEHVRTDGSPEGYFQYLLLSVMANQFYRSWHASYNDRRVLCSFDALEGILAGAPGDLGDRRATLPSRAPATATRREGLAPEALERVLALDPAPRVLVTADPVRVRMLTFSDWGGFCETACALERGFPHRMSDQQVTTLVPYDCGITF